MKRILITGANRGVGFELARQCAARGDRVFAGCRSLEKAGALEKIAAEYPGQVTILPLDVTDEASIAESGCSRSCRSRQPLTFFLITLPQILGMRPVYQR